jgi:hypothetical protein
VDVNESHGDDYGGSQREKVKRVCQRKGVGVLWGDLEERSA